MNGIAVGEQTFRATERAIDYRKLEPVEAKGKAQPVAAWEVVEARARIAVERVHGARLVGRRRKVSLFEDALARVLEERSSQLVTLVGVPGIGKSRLVLELYEAIERLPELISWRQGRCLPYGDGVTFWALAEMVKAQAGILEGNEQAEAEQKLRAVSFASRIRMLAGEHQESVRLGEEALAMATELGLDEIRAAALNNVGSSRAELEGEEGTSQLVDAIEVARRANAPFELCRGLGNLAVLYWRRGNLLEAAALWRESLQESEKYGQRGMARWDYGILTNVDHELGRWDEAVAGADAFLAEVEAGSPHYLAPECSWVRAMIRLARGDAEPALGDVDRGIELARRAKDPQLVYQMLAYAAHVLHEMGERVRAGALAEEFADAIKAREGIGFSVVAVHRLAWTLTAVGRGTELAAALEPYAEPWARAGAAFAHGDPVGAAEICAGIGAVTQEAYARLAAARMLVEHGRRAEADEQLHRALAFYRSVGAARYVREGEALLAVSA